MCIHFRVGYRLPAYGELESPKFGSYPKFTGSPKFSQETITCDSDGKAGHDDYIKGEFIGVVIKSHISFHLTMLIMILDNITNKSFKLLANGTAAHFGGLSDDALSLSESVSRQFSPEVENAIQGVQFIAQHIRDNDKDNEVFMEIRLNIKQNCTIRLFPL